MWRECSTSVHLFCPIISCPLGCFCPCLGVCLVRGFYFLSIMASPITASCPDYKYFKKDPNYPHCCLCDVKVSEDPFTWRWHVQGKQHKRKKEKLKVEEAPPKGAGGRRERSPSVTSRKGSEESDSRPSSRQRTDSSETRSRKSQYRSRSPSCSHQPGHGKRMRLPSMCAATGPELFECVLP